MSSVKLFNAFNVYSCLFCSGLNPSHYPHAEFVGQNIEDFCHVNDLMVVSKHYEDGKRICDVDNLDSAYCAKTLLWNLYNFKL